MREDTGIIKAGMAIVISISSMTRNGLKNGERSVDYENN